jgi:hypothetical protein
MPGALPFTTRLVSPDGDRVARMGDLFSRVAARSMRIREMAIGRDPLEGGEPIPPRIDRAGSEESRSRDDRRSTTEPLTPSPVVDQGEMWSHESPIAAEDATQEQVRPRPAPNPVTVAVARESTARIEDPTTEGPGQAPEGTDFTVAPAVDATETGSRPIVPARPRPEDPIFSVPPPGDDSKGQPEVRPEVRVHIGRLDVRANLEPSVAPATHTTRPAESLDRSLTLDDYLKGRKVAP